MKTYAYLIGFFVATSAFFIGANVAHAQSWSGSCYDFTTDLQIGSTGTSVQALHGILAREGFYRTGGTTGNQSSVTVYDEVTASLVSGFQEKYRSTVLGPASLQYPTGYLGWYTRNKLNSLYSCNGGGGQNSSFSPVISNFVAPTNLQINEVGTWTLTATDPQNDTLSYYVTWGDEVYYASQSQLASPAINLPYQQARFTHTYAQPGTYTVTFRVRDPQGNEARSSATVTVASGGIITGTNYPRILSPNGGESLQKGTYYTLQWQLPNVQYFAAQGVDVSFVLQNSTQYPYSNNNPYYQTGNNAYSTCPIGTTCAYSAGGSGYYSPYQNSGYYTQPLTSTGYYSQSSQYPTYYQTDYAILQNTTLSSHSWNVGTSPSVWAGMPTGSYLMKVCLTGTPVCDMSDSTVFIY